VQVGQPRTVKATRWDLHAKRVLTVIFHRFDPAPVGRMARTGLAPNSRLRASPSDDWRQPSESITHSKITFSWVFPFPSQSVILSHEVIVPKWGGQMSRADEESIRQEYEQRHPGVDIPKIPRSHHPVDKSGQVYEWRSGAGGWCPTGQINHSAAARLNKGFPPVYQEEAVTGQLLYENPGIDPNIDRTIRSIPDLRLPVLPKSNGLGALGWLGIVGFLTIIGVVIWIIVVHLGSSGYPPEGTLADSYGVSGGRSVSEIAFSWNGKELVAADSYSGANLWNVDNDSQIYDFNTIDTAERATFSPNGALVAVGDYYGNVTVFNIANKRQLAQFTDPLANGFNGPNAGGVYGLAFSPDGNTLAAAEFSGKVHLWDIASGRETATLAVPSDDTGGLVGSLAFSPNGRIVAVGDPEGTTYVWDAATGKLIAILNYPHASTTGIAGIAFSPRGHILATLQTDGTAILWNVSTWKQIYTLSAGDSSYGECSIAFSPGGKTLAAGCNGANAYLWNLASKQQIATLTAPSGDIDGVAFSPDGSILAAGTSAGYIYLWNAETVGSK